MWSYKLNSLLKKNNLVDLSRHTKASLELQSLLSH